MNYPWQAYVFWGVAVTIFLAIVVFFTACCLSYSKEVESQFIDRD